MRDNLNKIRNIFTRFKDLSALGIANISASAISGLFWLYMARLLGTTNYGEISYILAVSGIAIVISFMGASNVLQVYNPKGVKIQPAIFFISIISSIASSIIVFLIIHSASASLFVIGNIVFGLSIADLLGYKLYQSYSKYLVIQKVLATILAISFFYILGPKGVILGLGLSFFVISGRVYHVFKGAKIDFSVLKPRLGFIINSYALDISRSFNTSIDKLIVAPLLGYSLLGNYQLGIQILTVLSLLPSIVFQYTLPQDASGNPSKRIKNLSILASVILAILGVTLSPIIMPILFPKFVPAIQVIQIVSLSIIPGSINLTLVSKFLGNEKSRIVLIGSAIFFAVEIPGMILLGKAFAVNGVAIAWDLSAVAEMIYLIIVNRIFTHRKGFDLSFRA